MFHFQFDQFSVEDDEMTPPIDEGVEPPQIIVLDGGFSTQLSCHVGHVIDGDPLWSARFLHSNPDEVVSTHLDFLRGNVNSN